jgi:hypothetical protein
MSIRSAERRGDVHGYELNVAKRPNEHADACTEEADERGNEQVGKRYLD